jgi:hypothetical protein
VLKLVLQIIIMTTHKPVNVKVKLFLLCTTTFPNVTDLQFASEVSTKASRAAAGTAAAGKKC